MDVTCFLLPFSAYGKEEIQSLWSLSDSSKGQRISVTVPSKQLRWMEMRNPERLSETLANAYFDLNDMEAIRTLSEQCHSLLDLLPVIGVQTVVVLLVDSQFMASDFFATAMGESDASQPSAASLLYGLLHRAIVWHNAIVTVFQNGKLDYLDDLVNATSPAQPGYSTEQPADVSNLSHLPIFTWRGSVVSGTDRLLSNVAIELNGQFAKLFASTTRSHVLHCQLEIVDQSSLISSFCRPMFIGDHVQGSSGRLVALSQPDRLAMKDLLASLSNDADAFVLLRLKMWSGVAKSLLKCTPRKRSTGTATGGGGGAGGGSGAAAAAAAGGGSTRRFGGVSGLVPPANNVLLGGRLDYESFIELIAQGLEAAEQYYVGLVENRFRNEDFRYVYFLMDPSGELHVVPAKHLVVNAVFQAISANGDANNVKTEWNSFLHEDKFVESFFAVDLQRNFDKDRFISTLRNAVADVDQVDQALNGFFEAARTVCRRKDHVNADPADSHCEMTSLPPEDTDVSGSEQVAFWLARNSCPEPSDDDQAIEDQAGKRRTGRRKSPRRSSGLESSPSEKRSRSKSNGSHSGKTFRELLEDVVVSSLRSLNVTSRSPLYVKAATRLYSIVGASVKRLGVGDSQLYEAMVEAARTNAPIVIANERRSIAESQVGVGRTKSR